MTSSSIKTLSLALVAVFLMTCGKKGEESAAPAAAFAPLTALEADPSKPGELTKAEIDAVLTETGKIWVNTITLREERQLLEAFAIILGVSVDQITYVLHFFDIEADGQAASGFLAFVPAYGGLITLTRPGSGLPAIPPSVELWETDLDNKEFKFGTNAYQEMQFSRSMDDDSVNTMYLKSTNLQYTYEFKRTSCSNVMAEDFQSRRYDDYLNSALDCLN